MTLRYVEEFEYYNPNTREVYEDDIPEGQPYCARAVKYRDVEYEVVALVDVPHALGYRYYGDDQFVLNDQTFIRDTGTSSVMLYTFDMEGQAGNEAMESFLADYTENQNPQYDYESRATYAAEFESFRSMFLLLGGALSFIVGLAGILIFFNAILTGILTRRREFAVLQSIGMTGRQLKKMLVYEGLYALGAVAPHDRHGTADGLGAWEYVLVFRLPFYRDANLAASTGVRPAGLAGAPGGIPLRVPPDHRGAAPGG